MNFLTTALLCAGLAVADAAAAAELRVLVKDQHGKPVADAVVSLRPTGAVPPAAPGAVAVMSQRDKAFQPRVLAVRTGTRVEFPNHDPVRHHVYSFSPPKPFELKLYSGAVTPSVTFTTPGAVALGCNIHDWMQGYIYVTDDPAFAVTASDGVTRFGELDATDYRIRIWHPRLLDAQTGDVGSVSLRDPTAWNSEFVITLRTGPRPAQAPEADMDPFYGRTF